MITHCLGSSLAFLRTRLKANLCRVSACLYNTGVGLPVQDLRRIKQEGPRLEDVTRSYPFTFAKEKGGKDTGVKYSVDYKWVPKDVVTAAGQYVGEEPDWASLPQMPYMHFYQARLMQKGCSPNRPSPGATCLRRTRQADG